jgi:hypothetical protein
MRTAAWLMVLTGAYPLWRAWLANRSTTLFQAVNWAIAAWAAWGGMMMVVLHAPGATDSPTATYLALCLTACAGVAVLGARRPGVVAWNFVLFGLLAVLLLPLAESLLAQRPALDPPRVLFLAATVAVVVLNYLPTRLAPAALLLGAGSVLELLNLTGQTDGNPVPAWWLLGLTPWVALGSWRTRPRPAALFDQVWLDFRDRFGFLWGQRLREQFNRAAANAGWPVVLRWQGLRLTRGASLPGLADQAMIVDTLRALLKRFGAAEPKDSTGIS